MATRNPPRVAQYDAAFVVVPSSMKSNSTPLRSLNTEAIIFASRFAHQFFRSRGSKVVPLHACTFCLRRVTVNARLVSSDNALEEIMAMNAIQLGE